MSNLPANISNLVGNLEAAQAAAPAASGDFAYLKMSKAGEWVYGADETEVDSESVFVIDPASYSQGFVAWDDGELVDERMAVAGAAPITQADLPDLGAGIKWDSQVAFALKGVEGVEAGVQLLYKTSSKGGKGAIAKLLATIIERAKSGAGDICPIVLLDTDSYKHKKFGKIYTPVLTVDDWMDAPDGTEPEPEAVAAPEVEPVVEEVVEPEPAAKPARTSRRKRTAG